MSADEQVEALKKTTKPTGSGRLHDKVSIVTGGSSSIGRAISLAYAREGARVVVADLRTASTDPAESAVATHDLIARAGGTAAFKQLDVTDGFQFEAIVNETVREFGRLDVLVNNAGVTVSPEKGSECPIWEHEESAFDLCMDVNGKGVFHGSKFASRVMINQEPGPTGDRGWIINIASIYGLVAFNNLTAYAASKFACMGITKVAALDCAPYKVHVNAICPGFVKTPLSSRVWNHKDAQIRNKIEELHPFKGLGTAEDVAPVAVFLASEDASRKRLHILCQEVAQPYQGYESRSSVR